MTLFDVTLLVNSVTLAITVVAAIKRPILSYKLIAGTAVCATGFALCEVLTDRENAFALLFTALLVAMIMWRVALNLRSSAPVRKRR
jgi:hypothetical protein